MKTYDFSPFFRSSVGFDRLFDMIDSNALTDWPPYNIEKRGDHQYRISMAVTGFGQGDIELVQQGNALIITGHRKPAGDQHETLHNGLAFRDFKQTFNLADHVKATSARVENGLLTVELVLEVPEQLKPRRIEVGFAGDTRGQDNQQSLNAPTQPQSVAA
jgi:molecular chaperone IbpA